MRCHPLSCHPCRDSTRGPATGAVRRTLPNAHRDRTRVQNEAGLDFAVDFERSRQLSKNTPGSLSALARKSLLFSRRWGAGQLAGWLLAALVLVYAVWFFGFATVHAGPSASLPVRTLASDRPFGEVQAMLDPLMDQSVRIINRTGIDRPTTWMMANIPRGLRGRPRTLHLTEKSISHGEAVLLNRDNEAVLWTYFGVGIQPYESRRALPGFAIDIPLDWNTSDDLTLVLRIEPAGTTNTLGIDLWDSKRFEDAQVKLQQRTAMLIGALMLLAIYALAAAQAGKVPYLLAFAFWLVARCGFVMTSGGFHYLSFGEMAGSGIGMGLRQVALLAFPCATTLLVWSLTQAELRGTLSRRLLRMAMAVSCGATAVAGFLPFSAFQVTLWVTAGFVIMAILFVIQSGYRLIDNTTTRWYLGGLLLDVTAGVNELLLSMGFASPAPWLTLQQVSLVSAMLTGIAVGSMVAKEREKRLRAQEAAIEFLGRYEAVYQTVPIGLISFGPDDRAERFNDGFARMFGLPMPSAGPIGSGIDEPLRQALNQAFPLALRNRIRAELHGVGECDFPYRLGDEHQTRWLRILARGSQTSFEASVTDITDHKNTERRLAHAAEHDALTGALNRRGLSRRIGRLLESGDAIDDYSLVYLDLDRFKMLNDLFGHQAGDSVLQEVVSRLQAALGEKVAVARLGGDEFAALLDAGSRGRHEELTQLALLAISGEPFQIPSRSFTVTASVGMFRLAPGLTQEALIAGADRACLDAKRKGRNQVVIQNDATALIKRQMAELSVLADLGDANSFGEFELTIQPIISLHDSRRIGGEVLLRQRAADGSLESAEILLDAAEERGEMANVDRWMLRQSLQWLSRHAGRFGSLDFLSLNLSGASLNDEFFKTFVLALLHKHHAVARLVVIEITESVAMQDVFVMEKFIAQLRETGARIALDDFGSGYSSFASLNDVGASYLKIDGRFVQALSTQGANTTIIRTITVLAHELGMECIAVSAEDAKTLALLKQLGADYGQGMTLCPPLPLADFEAFCAGGRFHQAPEVRAVLGGMQETSPLAPLATGGVQRPADLPVTVA